MKLCRFDDDRLGVIIQNKVHDVTQAQAEIRAAAPYAMLGDAVIAALPTWREKLARMAEAAPCKALSDVRLLSPIARPSKVMAAPSNYHEHVEEMQRPGNLQNSGGRFPLDLRIAGIFLKANSALVGPSFGVPIRFPERRNDHEAELVMIIGKSGSDIPEERALDYVAGYCLGLDMTVRGKEDRSFRKSIDGYAVVGPWIVTADEISDPSDLPLKLHVNSELRQDTNTSRLINGIGKLIAFASSFYTLHPGDVFYTGTPSGVGPVLPGDWISVRSIDSLGELRVEVRSHEINY